MSDSCHKALLRIGDGRSWTARDRAAGPGCRSRHRCHGYRAEEVREYLTQRFPPGCCVSSITRFAETNNVVSLGLALGALGAMDCDASGDVVLTECDLLLDPAVD